MNTAQRVNAKFGSQNSLAQVIGRKQSTVQYWAKTGVIPAKWHPILLRIATEQGIELSPFDLVAPAEIVVIEPNETPPLPKATHWGELEIGNVPIPCYRLDNDQRVFSLKGVIVGLMQTEHGNLGEYLK